MKHLLILGGLLMAASVVAPVAVMADDHHREKRYYESGPPRLSLLERRRRPSIEQLKRLPLNGHTPAQTAIGEENAKTGSCRAVWLCPRAGTCSCGGRYQASAAD
jgi:hypothetical protein